MGTWLDDDVLVHAVNSDRDVVRSFTQIDENYVDFGCRDLGNVVGVPVIGLRGTAPTNARCDRRHARQYRGKGTN